MTATEQLAANRESEATSVFSEGVQPTRLRRLAHMVLGHLQNPSPSEWRPEADRHLNGNNVHFEGEEYRG